MDLLTSFASAMTSLKTAKELVDCLRQSDAEAELEKLKLLKLLNEVSGQLLTLQTQSHALEENTRKLVNELATLRNWRDEQANYTLVKLPSGAYVYAHKGVIQSHKSELYICPHCYEKETKSILQPHDVTPVPAYSTLICPACKMVYKNERIEDAPVIYPPSKHERGCW